MSEPAYRQVASALRREIQQGVWEPGAKLPTGKELQNRFKVSTTTVKSAIAELNRENLVYTQTSRGTIVRSRQVLDHVVTRPLRPDRNNNSGHDVFVETAQQAGRTPGKEFQFSIETSPDVITRRLGGASDELRVRRAILQYVDGEPWSWEVSYFPLDLAEETGIDTPHDIAEGTTRRLRDRGYGEVAWVDEQTAHPAEADEAHVLSVPVGTWITDLIRTGATEQRITRVTRNRWLTEHNRTVYELGDDTGLNIIYSTRKSS